MTRLEEIAAREAKATAGPWEPYSGNARHDPVFHQRRTVCAPAGGFAVNGKMAVAYCDYMTPEYAENNATFIAHARSDIPFLLSLVSSLQADLAQARVKALEEAAHVCESNAPYYSQPIKLVQSNSGTPFSLLLAKAIRALASDEGKT